MGPLARCYDILCKQPSKRSILLLAIFVAMLTYIILQDFAYPYDNPEGLLDDDIQSDIAGDSTESGPRSGEIEQAKPFHYCEVNDVTKPYDADFRCIRTMTTPSATVCIYSDLEDMFISHDLGATGVWEPQVLADIQEALIRNEDAGFLDIGANVGFYSLIAARMGHRVVAVEPVRENVWRIHRALQMDATFNKVTVLRNAVAETRDKVLIQKSGDNQGDHRIHMDYRPCRGSCPPTVNTILLDDLLEVTNFSSAIMKLDIQGFEHRAFQHAAVLLDRIQVQYIFMEWLLMRTFYVSERHTSSDKVMVEEMVRLLFTYGYRPYSLAAEGGRPLDPRTWGKWPFDVVWIRLPSGREQTRIISNHFRNWPPS